MQLDSFEWARSASYIALAIVVLMNVAANLLLKIGAGPPRSLLISFAGLCCFGFSALPYWWALRNVGLNSAQIIVSSQYALVILAAWLVLGEAISTMKWFGIGLVAAGLFLAMR